MRYDLIRRRMIKKAGVKTLPPKRDFFRRDVRLRLDGFLNWERVWLAQNRIDSLPMKSIRNDRRKLMLEFKGDGWTRQSYLEYRRHITAMYLENKWRFKDGTRNPFAMIDALRREQDLAETPQPKRRRRIRRTYKERAAKTRAKQVKIPGHEKFQRKHRLPS